ncbi:EAL domain-containing protein [Nitrogeniibacter mangrovi]|uniref:EAL domain-containing protein n=1 Tax=Nitrogeniibacter mangrovi TaxID=2016596 RepID=A0A6C1AZF1_9RHOO|nr:EAL domain-containing protein [Nitrogeniibacter mangrovi]QID16732.1 EAL domain-containing protein [Nitrogeniibacter mangrovi]
MIQARPPAAYPLSLKLLLVALSYGVLGVLSLQMAIAPGYVAPLYPPAGIAVAAVLMFGYRALPAIFLGSFATNIVSSLTVGLELGGLINASIVGLGACVQAVVARVLIERHATIEQSMSSGKGVIRLLLLGGPVACLVNATISVSSLVAFGVIQGDEVAFSWANWWAGDSLGVLVFLPLVLAIVRFPRSAWTGRRNLVVWPLLFALLMLAIMIFQIGRWESERLQNDFQRDVRALSQLLISRLTDQLDALHATHQTIEAQQGADGRFFQGLVAPWLARYPGLHVVGWAPLVKPGELDEFTAWARANVTPDFRVFQRDRAGHEKSLEPASFYLPITLVAPLERNRAVVGLDPLGFAPADTALRRSMALDGPVATRPIRLQQETGAQRGVIVYHVVRDPTIDDPQKSLIGMVYVGLRMGDEVDGVLAESGETQLRVCLFDEDDAGRYPLYGTEGCETAALSDSALAWQTPLDFAGRKWHVRIVATPVYANQHRGWAAWAMLIVNPLAVSLLGAFLLVTSGHTQRVEALVRERTAQLELSGEQLRAGQAALARAQALAQLGSWELDVERQQVHWSDQMLRMLGLRPGATLSFGAFLDRLQMEDRASLIVELARLDDAPAFAELDCRFSDGTDANRIGHFHLESERLPGRGVMIRGTVRDVTDARAAEAHIQYLAHFDPLTHLPNRAFWIERVRAQVMTARRHQEQFAVLFLDLDQFKTVNDSLGHAIGDRLLAVVASRLQSVLREDDLLARQGGDEFVAMLTRLPRAEDAAVVANKMTEVLREPIAIDHHELSVSVSIGIALYPQDATDADVLLKQADLAMYSAKEAGRNAYQFFRDEMNLHAQHQLRMSSALRRALERDEFELHYQPQVSGADGRIVGYEALLRWESGVLGRVPPAEFIPVAEATGLILPIGEWVLRTAFAQQARWREDGEDTPRLAINISALQFRHEGFVAKLEQLLAGAGADPARIELEITESALMQGGGDMVERLQRLRRIGFTLALDDFGTGYSSLAYLKRFPIERLKIDRSFVRDLPDDPEDCAIADATLSLARDLGMEVVAEGVETEAQRSYLTARGCHVLQGYLFGRPQPARVAFDGPGDEARMAG